MKFVVGFRISDQESQKYQIQSTFLKRKKPKLEISKFRAK